MSKNKETLNMIAKSSPDYAGQCLIYKFGIGGRKHIDYCEALRVLAEEVLALQSAIQEVYLESRDALRAYKSLLEEVKK